jgi:hypothetical protein
LLPAVLDLGYAPISDGDRPDRDEQADDDESDVVEAEAGDPAGDGVGEVEFVVQDGDKFDGADESNRLIPAANSRGRIRTAYQGRPDAAPVPASTSSAISVAVSKPRPNSSPTEYI